MTPGQSHPRSQAAAETPAPVPTLHYQPAAPTMSFEGASTGRVGDALLHWAAKGSAIVIILLLVGLVGVLTVSAVPSIKTYGAKFLVTRDWRPNPLEVPKRDANGSTVFEDGEMVMETIPPSFGALPVIYGTVVSSVLALFFAVPLSLGAAIFLVRVAPKILVGPVSFLIEFLAAVPSIAYGIWGLFVLAPFLQSRLESPLNGMAIWVEQHLYALLAGSGWIKARLPGLPWFSANATTGRDMLCGGMILAIMILPIITAIGRDVLRGVPVAQVEGTTALGATWWQSSKEMLKYSRSGLFGAVMLGLARAAGETMAVTMVIGNANKISASPFEPAQTMSSLLANEFAEASSDIHRSALIEVALILLVMSLLFNVVARYLVVGKQGRTAAAH